MSDDDHYVLQLPAAPFGTPRTLRVPRYGEACLVPNRPEEETTETDPFISSFGSAERAVLDMTPITPMKHRAASPLDPVDTTPTPAEKRRGVGVLGFEMSSTLDCTDAASLDVPTASWPSSTNLSSIELPTSLLTPAAGPQLAGPLVDDPLCPPVPLSGTELLPRPPKRQRLDTPTLEHPTLPTEASKSPVADAEPAMEPRGLETSIHAPANALPALPLLTSNPPAPAAPDVLRTMLADPRMLAIMQRAVVQYYEAAAVDAAPLPAAPEGMQLHPPTERDPLNRTIPPGAPPAPPAAPWRDNVGSAAAPWTRAPSYGSMTGGLLPADRYTVTDRGPTSTTPNPTTPDVYACPTPPEAQEQPAARQEPQMQHPMIVDPVAAQYAMATAHPLDSFPLSPSISSDDPWARTTTAAATLNPDRMDVDLPRFEYATYGLQNGPLNNKARLPPAPQNLQTEAAREIAPSSGPQPWQKDPQTLPAPAEPTEEPLRFQTYGDIAVLLPPKGKSFPTIHKMGPCDVLYAMEGEKRDGWEKLVSTEANTIFFVQVHGENAHGTTAYHDDVRRHLIRTIARLTDTDDSLILVADPDRDPSPSQGREKPCVRLLHHVPAKAAAILRERSIWPMDGLTFHLLEGVDGVPDFVAGWKGFVNWDRDTIRDSIVNAFKKSSMLGATARLLRPDDKEPTADALAEASKFFDEIRVELIRRPCEAERKSTLPLPPDALRKGEIVANVYCKPPVYLPSSWLRWRNGLRDIVVTSLYDNPARARAAVCCMECRGGDHLLDECPFHRIPGWFGTLTLPSADPEADAPGTCPRPLGVPDALLLHDAAHSGVQGQQQWAPYSPFQPYNQLQPYGHAQHQHPAVSPPLPPPPYSQRAHNEPHPQATRRFQYVQPRFTEPYPNREPAFHPHPMLSQGFANLAPHHYQNAEAGPSSYSGQDPGPAATGHPQQRPNQRPRGNGNGGYKNGQKSGRNAKPPRTMPPPNPN